MYYKLISKMVRFRIVMVAILCLGMLVGLYSIYWYAFAENLKENITLFLLDQVREGFDVSFEQIEVVGYPATFRIIMSSPSLVAKSVSQSHLDVSWRWKGVRAIAEVKPWSFNKVRVNLSGDHEVLIDTFKGHHEYTGSVAGLIVDLELHEDGMPASARLIGTGLQFTYGHTKNNISTKKIRLMAERLFSDNFSSKIPTLNIQFDLEELNFDGSGALPFGDAIKRLSTSIKVFGKIRSPFDILSLKKWSDDGGIIEFESIEGNYGPIEFNANGTLTLDDKLQILAAFSTKVRGVIVAIDRLTQAQIIQPSDAAMAKIFLSIFSKNLSDNGSPFVTLPLNIENGQLSIHHVKLLNVPKIEWLKTLKIEDGLGFVEE